MPTPLVTCECRACPCPNRCPPAAQNVTGTTTCWLCSKGYHKPRKGR